MATVACPGCGLPREEAHIGVRPCPVCADELKAPVEQRDIRKPLAKDPTAGLPSDVSELNRYAAPRSPLFTPLRLGFSAAFLLGIAAGVGGVLAWQTLFPPDGPPHDSGSQFALSREPSSSVLPTARPAVDLAPMPHEPLPMPTKEKLQPGPGSEPAVPPVPPRPAPPALPPANAIVIDVNQPDAAYVLPFAMRKGEHVIIRGKVKIFRVMAVDAGSILDASGLEASSIYVGGRIDGRSQVKLHAPGGTVVIASSVNGHSRLEIDATGGDIRFPAPTTPERPGCLIDGGAQLTLAARRIDLQGDINGVETKVTATLAAGGAFKLAAIKGTATVEYKVARNGPAPEVHAGMVAPSARLAKRP
jgi:hypothetical protein